MKNKILSIFGTLMILFGIGIFLYPDIANVMQNIQTNKLIDDFETYYDESRPSGNVLTGPKEDSSDKGENTGIPYEDLYRSIEEYNKSIYESGQKDFKDAWCYTQSPINIDCLENELFGYIEIPAMDVRLPLYIGASTSNMAKGAAIMGQTSIPIGGINTNSVISGHRGYKGSPYFREIEKLNLGDYVYITNPWGTLVYQAVEISVIDPYNSPAVRIREGKDMITLLTCHPYMSGGKYRYLVFCEHVPDDQTNAESLPDNYQEINQNKQLSIEGYTFESSQSLIDNEKLLRHAGAAAITLIVIVVIIKKIVEKKKNRYRY